MNQAADVLAIREKSFTTPDSFGKPFVSGGDIYLGKSGIDIDEDATARQIVFFSPNPKRQRTNNEQIGFGATLRKFFCTDAGALLAAAVMPLFPEAERLEALMDVTSGIFDVIDPLFFFPVIGHRFFAAVLEINDVVTEFAQSY